MAMNKSGFHHLYKSAKTTKKKEDCSLSRRETFALPTPHTSIVQQHSCVDVHSCYLRCMMDETGTEYIDSSCAPSNMFFKKSLACFGLIMLLLRGDLKDAWLHQRLSSSRNGARSPLRGCPSSSSSFCRSTAAACSASRNCGSSRSAAS